MSTVLKIILIFLVAIPLALILAPAGGALHNSFWGYEGCFFWPCDEGSTIEGFIYFYILLLSLLSFFLLKKKTAWLTFIFGSIIFWLLIIYATFDSLKFERREYIGTLAIMLVSFVIGYLLALGVKKLKNNA